MGNKKPVVITVHGIRTRGVWQKDFAAILADHEMVPESHDYDRFSLPQFAWAPARNKQVEQFYRKYNEIVSRRQLTAGLDDPDSRPSVVAHSFGTYLVGRCLEKYEHVKINKLILCGSILHPDFNWSLIFARDQVGEVRNDTGLVDRWVRLASLLVPDAGPSGALGFSYYGTLLRAEPHPHLSHSEYFSREQMEINWVPFLKRPSSSFRILHSRDVGSKEILTGYLNAANRIDNTCYTGDQAYSAAEIPRGLSSQWLEINSDLYTFLIERKVGALRGYINAMPMTRAGANRLITQGLHDNEIKQEDLEEYSGGKGGCPMYIMSIAVSPDARLHGSGLYHEPYERLVNALFSKLHYYALRKRFVVSHLVATGWTPQGRQLCRIFGLPERAKDKSGHPICWASIAEIEKNNSRIAAPVGKLLKLYRQLGLSWDETPLTPAEAQVEVALS